MKLKSLCLSHIQWDVYSAVHHSCLLPRRQVQILLCIFPLKVNVCIGHCFLKNDDEQFLSLFCSGILRNRCILPILLIFPPLRFGNIKWVDNGWKILLLLQHVQSEIVNRISTTCKTIQTKRRKKRRKKKSALEVAALSGHK